MNTAIILLSLTSVSATPGTVKVCHATGIAAQPYTLVEVDASTWTATPGRRVRSSVHWRHQAAYGGLGDFALLDESMSCADYAAWVAWTARRQCYIADGRQLWVACGSDEGPSGERIPRYTDFVDETDGHIISLPCPEWHGALQAPSAFVRTAASHVDYWVTDASGQFSSDGYYHTKWNPTPGTTRDLLLDATGGNFAVLCPSSGAIDVVQQRYDFFGGVQEVVVPQACALGDPVMKHPLFDFGDTFPPRALCPASGSFAVCFTGNSGFGAVPAGLTSTHSCFRGYPCVPGSPVDLTQVELYNAGYWEFPTAYGP